MWSSNFPDHIYIILLNFPCLPGLSWGLEEGSQARNLRLQRTDKVQGFVSFLFCYILLVCLLFDQYLGLFCKWTWCAVWDGVSLIKRRSYWSSVLPLVKETEKYRQISVCIWVCVWIQLQFFFEGKDFSLQDHACCIPDSQRAHLYLCSCVEGGMTVGNLTTEVAVCFPIYHIDNHICCVERLSTLWEKHVFGELL